MVEHGLVRPSFVPPPPIRALRDLTRHRRTLVEERTRVVQRLEKILQDAGIKLMRCRGGASAPRDPRLMLGVAHVNDSRRPL